MFLEMEVDAEMEKFWKLLTKEFPDLRHHKIPTVELVDTGTKGGLAYQAQNRIEINILFLKTHRKEIMERTLPHELAHIVVYRLFPHARQAHGPEFRHVLDTINVNNSTYHSMRVADIKEDSTKIRSKTRHLYECRCPGKQHKITPVLHNRIASGRDARMCKQCKGTIRLVQDGISTIQVSGEKK